MRFRFEIPGEPLAKARPRASLFGGHAHVYTPQKTANYEGKVALAFKSAYPSACPSTKALVVTLVFYFPLNKGDYTGTGKLGKHGLLKLAGKERHVKKPDCDNLAKSVLDGLNGIAFVDDSQICGLAISKRYAESPCCSVTICELM